MCSAAHLNRLDAEGRPTLIPIVSVGLTDDHSAYQLKLPADNPARGAYSEAAAVAMMNDVAQGKYDLDDAANGRYRVWPAILDAFKNQGFRKIYLRIGWEQNGNWYGWQVRSEATRLAYIAAWRHVADLVHAYASANGMTIETMWSPSASYANYGMSEESSYPGDSYVDIIAPTAYSPIWNATRSRDRTAYHDWGSGLNVSLAQWLANPINRRRIWDYPSADYWNSSRGWGIPAVIDFALARSKRFAFSETGTGNFGVTTAGGGPVDEGDYPIYLGERLAAAIAKGLQVEVVEIWPQATGSDRRTFLERRAAAGSERMAGLWRDAGRRSVAGKSRQGQARLSEFHRKQHLLRRQGHRWQRDDRLEKRRRRRQAMDLRGSRPAPCDLSRAPDLGCSLRIRLHHSDAGQRQRLGDHLSNQQRRRRYRRCSRAERYGSVHPNLRVQARLIGAQLLAEGNRDLSLSRGRAPRDHQPVVEWRAAPQRREVRFQAVPP